MPSTPSAEKLSDPVRNTLSMPDGQVSYLEWPADGPLLHFAHATGFNAETYRALLTPLAGRFHILAADARGHGFTSLPADPACGAPWTMYRDDLLHTLDRFGAKKIVLAGHSMGATTSLMTAAAIPDRIAGLVLIDPVMVPRIHWLISCLPRWLRPRFEGALADRAALRRDRFPSFDSAFAAYKGRGAFKSWPEEVLRDYLKGGLKIDPATGEATLACAPAWEAATFRAAMTGVARFAAKVTCPLTLLYGTVGTTCGDAGAAALSGKHPGTRVVKVDGASHFLPMERPEIVQQEFARLLD